MFIQRWMNEEYEPSDRKFGKYAVNMQIKRENDVKFKKINNLKENIRKLKNSVDKCQTIIYT